MKSLRNVEERKQTSSILVANPEGAAGRTRKQSNHIHFTEKNEANIRERVT